MSDDRRRARMGVSYNLIEHALKLPDGVRIERIEHNPDGWHEGFFVLSGPDFPDAIPGNDLIRVTPTITVVPESHAWDWALSPAPRSDADEADLQSFTAAQRYGLKGRRKMLEKRRKSPAPRSLGEET